MNKLVISKIFSIPAINIRLPTPDINSMTENSTLILFSVMKAIQPKLEIISNNKRIILSTSIRIVSINENKSSLYMITYKEKYKDIKWINGLEDINNNIRIILEEYSEENG